MLSQTTELGEYLKKQLLMKHEKSRHRNLRGLNQVKGVEFGLKLRCICMKISAVLSSVTF